MQGSETGELVTCEAGESEAHAVTVGSAPCATWAPVPQYVPCPPDKTGLGDGPAPAFRGDDGDTPTPPPAEFLGDATPPVAEFLPIAPVYQLPEKQDDWSGAKYSADFVPNARQQIVIDAVQTALNEGKYYTSDVLARCIELLNIDAHTASMNFGMRVEGGIVGMDCYYARGYIDAKKAREASLKTFNEMALREGDELGILVFTDYKRTTGVKITGISEGGSTFTFTGKRGINTVTGTGSADQLKCGIERAFTTGKRKTDYAAFIAAQAKRPTSTPPAVESQPTPPVMETPDTLESFDDTGDGVSDALYDAVQSATIAHVQALTDAQFSKLYDHLENWNFHTENHMLEALRIGDESIIADMRQVVSDQNEAGYLRGDIYDRRIAITERMRAMRQAKNTPASKQATAPAECAQAAINNVATYQANLHSKSLRAEWLAATQKNSITSKSGNWTAWTFKTVMGAFGLGFMQWDNFVDLSDYMTAKDRMKALQGMARAVDEFTPPGGGLPCPEPVAVVEPVASVAPTPSVAVSSHTLTPPIAVSSEFKRVGNVRVDLGQMVAQGVRPESLIGLGVYYEGNMANPSGYGAITATDKSDFHGLTVGVTLESGVVWHAVRASEFKEGSFYLDTKMHGAPYMAELAAKVAAIKASDSASKEIAATDHAKALIDLAAQYPQLKRAENTYAGGKLAAANMRILLKAAFKGVKFNVTSDYNSVRVNWTDGPSDKQVNEVVGRFDIGASDSQSDYFYTVSTAFSQLFGGVQYLSTRREVSDSLVQVAIDRLYSDRSEKPTVTDYRKCTGVFDWNSQNYENRQMREMLETLGK